MIWAFIIIGLLVLIPALLIYAIAPGRPSPEAKKTAEAFFGLNCAHRGLHTKNQQVPENSLPAFIAAREKGYGVELDVQLSKDGQVVVFHDDGLKRACGVDEPVKNLELRELSSLSLFGTGERIPLFTDVLKALEDTPVIVEIKSAGASNAVLCQKTLDILRAQGKVWCVESFDPFALAWFRKNAPDALRGQLSCPPRKFEGLSAYKAFLLGNLLLNFLSRPHFLAYSKDPRPFAASLCRAMKPINVVWTVRPEDDISRCEKENDTVIFEYYTPAPKYRH